MRGMFNLSEATIAGGAYSDSQQSFKKGNCCVLIYPVATLPLIRS